jgi:predicted acyltransferase
MGDAQKREALPRVQERLLSIDALRGFDMFWIIGGAAIAEAAAELTGWVPLAWLAGQMQHADWHGFTLYDLIFPLFLFLAGAAMPFSFARRLERGESKIELYRRVVVRGLLLVLLGLIYNGLLKFDWANMRYTSVLGRIGLAYLFAALIVLNTRWRAQLAWVALSLAGYWAALKLVPVPGFGAGDLAPGHTLTDYLDRLLMPGKLLHGDRDPLGILSTIPAISTALIGAITGRLLKTGRLSGYAKTIAMVVAATVCFGLAYLWHGDFPINKNLWSSSFVLHCAGWSLALLAFFYLVIDVWRLRAWALFFVVIGGNSILIYMARRFVAFSYTTHFLFDGVLRTAGPIQPLLWALAVVLVEWLPLLFLHRKRIFLRV